MAYISTELRIPDLWYDFYARLLPGTAFVAAVRTLILNNCALPSATGLFVLAATGYFLGLLLFPISNLASRGIHRLAERRHGKPKGYAQKIGVKLGPDTRWTVILSKLNAETAFFVQLTLFALVFVFAQFHDLPLGKPGLAASAALVPVLAVGAYLVSPNRVRHASDYEPGDHASIVAAVDRISSDLARGLHHISETSELPRPARDALERLRTATTERLAQLSQQVTKLPVGRPTMSSEDDGAS